MVHEVHDLKDAILEHLRGPLASKPGNAVQDDYGIDRWVGRRRYQPAEVAVMVESNSGLAQALVQHERMEMTREQTKLEVVVNRNAQANKQGGGAQLQNSSSEAADGSPVEFLFPLQVAELRNAYEKAGLLDDRNASNRGAPMRLRIPANEAGAPRDLPRAFTPATSAALDELELTQVLTTIARRPYQAVGVFATDPFDVVFLARQVRRYCPNVRLFTSCADLLLSRPGENIDLHGMLVASTYPLYPSNQWMTTPFRDAPRVFFGNRGAQGLYNATVAHLWEMRPDEPETLDPSTPQLLEFGFPYDVRPENHREPPVWISVVGERGLYPVTFVSRKISRGYLYNPESSPEQRRLTAWPAEQPSSEQTHAASATRPMPHLLFWLVCLSLLIACLFVAGITRRYACGRAIRSSTSGNR